MEHDGHFHCTDGLGSRWLLRECHDALLATESGLLRYSFRKCGVRGRSGALLGVPDFDNRDASHRIHLRYAWTILVYNPILLRSLPLARYNTLLSTAFLAPVHLPLCHELSDKCDTCKPSYNRLYKVRFERSHDEFCVAGIGPRRIAHGSCLQLDSQTIYDPAILCSGSLHNCGLCHTDLVGERARPQEFHYAEIDSKFT